VDASKSVDVYILEKEVGAQWMSACRCTRGVYMHGFEAGGRSTVKEGGWMYQRV
jgi:hypothetical protein